MWQQTKQLIEQVDLAKNIKLWKNLINRKNDTTLGVEGIFEQKQGCNKGSFPSSGQSKTEWSKVYHGPNWKEKQKIIES